MTIPSLPSIEQSRPVGLSCLYIGRVWHARFLPTIHKFGCVRMHVWVRASTPVYVYVGARARV